MVEQNPPEFLDGQCYTWSSFRQVFNSIICTDGVVDLYGGGLLVTADGGASINVTIAAGSAWIDGDLNGAQGIYHVVNDAAKPVTIGANGAGSDRIDLIIGSVYDSQYIGAVDQWAIEVVQGVAGGGVPAVPSTTRSGYVVFAEVLVPASGGTPSVVTDVRTSMSTCAAQPYVDLNASAATELAASSVETQIELGTVTYVDVEYFDTDTTPNAVGILEDGLFDVFAFMETNTAGAADSVGLIVYNGATPVIGIASGSGGPGGNWALPAYQPSVPLSAGDIIDVWGAQGDGSPHDALSGRLHIRKVG